MEQLTYTDNIATAIEPVGMYIYLFVLRLGSVL